MFNFAIIANSVVSNEFKILGCEDFLAATQFIRYMPYARNANKEDLLTVFSDGHATCGTKHALLRQLAIEHGQEDVKLILGMLRMDARFSPKIVYTLERHGLTYIPEAHNYLMIDGKRFDYTFVNSNSDDFVNDLMLEIEIEPQQISSFKVDYHRRFLQDWIVKEHISKSLDEVWTIREQCIADLAT
ncbi:MAG: hypothetical protein EOP51_01720 [Sphingobacteriales bacterium]|nr:MAG: hypothetical protein EOP51_01720 [Sphingobacteriales bacterium]